MIPIAKIVKGVVYDSEVALSALREGSLNYTAYARRIQKEVAAAAKKPVQLGSIVIALSRLRKELAHEKQSDRVLVPDVLLENIVVKSGLVEVTFERTRENTAIMQRIYADRTINTEDFFMLSQGVGEITLITSEEHKKHLDSILRGKRPKAVIRALVAISIKFHQKQLHLPNIIFSLVRALALKHINIIEIVSTRSELAFIIHQSELQSAFTTLNEIYQRGIASRE